MIYLYDINFEFSSREICIANNNVYIELKLKIKMEIPALRVHSSSLNVTLSFTKFLLLKVTFVTLFKEYPCDK